MSNNIEVIQRPTIIEVVTGCKVIATDYRPQRKLSMLVGSVGDLVVGDDVNDPSLFVGMDISESSYGVSLNSLDGSVTNITGRDVDSVVGTISFQPDKTGGGVSKLQLWSEYSVDGGVTWTPTPNSLRTIEIPNSGESFNTLLSAFLNWTDGMSIRFRAFNASGGTIQFISPSIQTSGVGVDGYSVVWELHER